MKEMFFFQVRVVDELDRSDPRNCLENLRTFALIVCAQRYCAGYATVICHVLLRALVKLRF